MKIPEHIAFSLLIAQFGLQTDYGPWGAFLAAVAGCLPDADGLGLLLGGWNSYRAYHRFLSHNVVAAFLAPLALAALASGVFALGPFLPLWGWMELLFVGHIATDVIFYRWPVPLLWPFSWKGWEVGLVSWNDLVPTLVLYAGLAAVYAFPARAAWLAAATVIVLAGYLAARALGWQPRSGWTAWITGEWAKKSPRMFRWLTGDFVT